MRDFLISSLSSLVMLIVFLMMIGTVAGALVALNDARGPFPGLSALVILTGGFIATVVFGGAVFLQIGIYENTKRMAEALEKQAL